MTTTETKLRLALIDYARAYDGKGISYTDLITKAGVDLMLPQDRFELTRALSTIFEFEHNNGRELLTILVRYKDITSKGRQFYALLKDYGYDKKSVHPIKSELFDIEETSKVIKFWKDDKNYQEFKKYSINSFIILIIISELLPNINHGSSFLF